VMLDKVGLASFDGSGTGRSTLLLGKSPCQPSRALILAR